MMKQFKDLMRDTQGATAIEYAMIGVLVSVACVAGLTLIGPALIDMFSSAQDAF